MRQEWCLLDPSVKLFEQIEEGVDLSVDASTPTSGVQVVNILNLMILRTGGIEKSCEKWKDMIVGQKNWKIFNDYFVQAYMRCQIRKKETASVHGYGTSENHVNEKDAQIMAAYALQTLANSEIEEKKAIKNLTRISLTLYQILTQVQEEMLVLYKQL